MTEFGLLLAATEHTLQPVEIALLAEREGFDALFLGEHTHLPLAAHRYSNIGDEYKQLYDPFIALTAAAAVTERLKLGTAVTLLTEHHPITLANEIATLDRISGGRVVLGVGTGWNVAEMSHFGLAFKDRWKIARERVLAMRAIWANDEAEFHGDFVDFDPIWCCRNPCNPVARRYSSAAESIPRSSPVASSSSATVGFRSTAVTSSTSPCVPCATRRNARRASSIR